MIRKQNNNGRMLSGGAQFVHPEAKPMPPTEPEAKPEETVFKQPKPQGKRKLKFQR
jgi:hypothetical protein